MDEPTSTRAQVDAGSEALADWARWRMRFAAWVCAALALFLVVVAALDDPPMLLGAVGCALAALVALGSARLLPAEGTATRRGMRRASLLLLLGATLMVVVMVGGIALALAVGD